MEFTLGNLMGLHPAAKSKLNRRLFIGGSDARIIMSPDKAALIRLWKEKRGEVESEDLSGNLIVQLGVVTEALNRSWYERNTGRSVVDSQRWVQHPVKRWMAATLDGFVTNSMRSSRPSLRCPGRSPRRRRRKSIWLSFNTTCG
jgi:predicted phage-related endonuclease